jgi:hypothetical protein
LVPSVQHARTRTLAAALPAYSGEGIGGWTHTTDRTGS